MEEFQEADILWPESMQKPKSSVNWSTYLQFTPSPSSSSTSSSSNSSCMQDELQESELSWPGNKDDSYFDSVLNIPEKISSDEEWQEADVLWPDQGSLKHHDFKVAPENCSVRNEDRPMIGEATKISSPIDIPKRKTNRFGYFL